MKLTVLGGAAACPNPGQGCSSYLVEEDQTRLLLDCGPDTLAVLRAQTDFRLVSAIFLSHLHADHMLDLIPYRYGLKYGPNRDGKRIPLWLPPGGAAFLDRLAAALAFGSEQPSGFFTDVFEIAEYDPARTYQVGRCTIAFQPTHHAIPCWAIKVVAGRRSLVYLADTGPADLAGFARDADLLICEGTMPASVPDESAEATSDIHLTPNQAGAIAAEASAKQLLLTHLWAELGVQEARAAAETAFGGPVMVAQPGFVVSL